MCDSPGGGSKGSDECLQQTPNEAVRVSPGHQEVEQWQDKQAVDEETYNDWYSIHAQLTPDLSQILHFYNLPSNQKQNTHRSIPDINETRVKLLVWEKKKNFLSILK